MTEPIAVVQVTATPIPASTVRVTVVGTVVVPTTEPTKTPEPTVVAAVPAPVEPTTEPLAVPAAEVVEPEPTAEAAIEPPVAVAEPEARVVTIEDGDTVWDLLTEALGHAPTWEQIQQVVDANDLVDKGVNEGGVWIVLIYAGQTIDLSPALGG